MKLYILTVGQSCAASMAYKVAQVLESNEQQISHSEPNTVTGLTTAIQKFHVSMATRLLIDFKDQVSLGPQQIQNFLTKLKFQGKIFILDAPQLLRSLPGVISITSRHPQEIAGLIERAQ